MENRRDAVDRRLANPNFTTKQLNRLATITICATLTTAIALIGSFVREFKPREREYFEYTKGVAPIRIFPLSEPVLTRAEVTNWARDCALSAYRVNYADWPQQQRDARTCFLDDTWRQFGMASAANLEFIRTRKIMAVPHQLGEPFLVQDAVIHGRYVWHVQMPIKVQWENWNGESPQDLLIDMNITRSADPEHPRGIAFSAFVARPHDGRPR